MALRKRGRIRLDIRKKVFTVKIVRHRKKLPREVVAVPSLGVFMSRLDRALSNLILLKVSLLIATNVKKPQASPNTKNVEGNRK